MIRRQMASEVSFRIEGLQKKNKSNGIRCKRPDRLDRSYFECSHSF